MAKIKPVLNSIDFFTNGKNIGCIEIYEKVC